ncbi:YbjN domain-containing protein [Rhodobacter capsulatus]|uniref:YbjN domain-containing protein n=1 Tax=Rhodobacter capsulatus TaxID=1061 RepID=UPI004026E1BA
MIRPFVAVLVAMLAALPAQAQVMADPDVVAAFLQDYGLKVDPGRDDQGDPMLSSEVDDTKFDVYFYGCTQTRDCTSVAFSAVFLTEEPLKYAMLNGWNKNARFGRAYVDGDGNAVIEYDVNLDKDGVGGKNFTDTIDIWRSLLDDFRNHINW